VVGENGAFYFRYDAGRRQMIRRFLRTDEERAQDRATLKAWFAALKQAHPQIKLSADQDYRISDIAIDVCEDVAALGDAEVQEIIAALTLSGATVKLSSIHVNAWIGKFDKLSMSKTYLGDELGIAPSDLTRCVLYIGDSPNDEPMFRFFTATVGVQNIAKYLSVMAAGPAFLQTARPIFAAPAAAQAAVPQIPAVPGGLSSAQSPTVPAIPPTPLAAPEIRQATSRPACKPTGAGTCFRHSS